MLQRLEKVKIKNLIMAKKIIIVHGWGGNPKSDWYSWLNKELIKKGFDSEVPKMPDSFRPTIKEWVGFLNNTIGEVDEDTYLVGHSIGCQTILRYLESLNPDKKVGGVLLVAGWLNLTDETWDEDYTPLIADQWLNTPIDFQKIKNHCNNFTIIQSDSDPYVPYSDAEIISKKLDAEIIAMHNAGHISGEDGFKTLPIALESITEMINK